MSLDPAFLSGDIEDPELRCLARRIRRHGIGRDEAFEALRAFRASVPFDSSERLTIEVLLDRAEELIE